MSLPKSMHTITLLGSAVAGIVGSGWLLGPLVCAKIAGPASILTWPIAGLLMMIVASTFVLLTRAAPITGGTARFFQMTYGHFAGFGFSWIAWIAWVAVSPIETMALIQYSTNYIPTLMTHTGSPVLTNMGLTVAIFLMILITAINNFGTNVYSKVNHFILAFKLIIPIATALILLTTHAHYANLAVHGGFTPFGIHAIFTALPLAGVIYSFIGFNPVIQCAAEAKNPERAIPLAIFGALFICMILYSLVQLAFITSLPLDTLKNGWAHISFSGQNGPFAGLLTLLGFGWFVKALYIDAAVSPFGTAFVQSMATSRLTYGMSESGYFSKSFMKVNKHGTPARALLLNMIVGLLFFLPFPSWQHMVGFLVSCLVIGYIIGPMSLMVMIQKKPQDYPFHPVITHVICTVAFTICNLMIYWSGWSVMFKLLVLFAIGYLVLSLNHLFNKKNGLGDLQILRGCWVIFYLIGMGLISYLGSFGGIKIIPFGIDFLIVFAFSILIYSLAYRMSRHTLNNSISD